MVYDGVHLAFNIPNIRIADGNYYCPLALKEEFNDTIKSISTLEQCKNDINNNLQEINEQIKQSPAYLAVNYPSFRYSLTSFDINRLNQLYKDKSKLEEQQKMIDIKMEEIAQNMLNKCKKF